MLTFDRLNGIIFYVNVYESAIYKKCCFFFAYKADFVEYFTHSVIIISVIKSHDTKLSAEFLIVIIFALTCN
jgi:hypothetical protein